MNVYGCKEILLLNANKPAKHIFVDQLYLMLLFTSNDIRSSNANVLLN